MRPCLCRPRQKVVGATAALECIVAPNAEKVVDLVVADQPIVVVRTGDVSIPRVHRPSRCRHTLFPTRCSTQDDQSPLAGIAVIRAVDAPVAGEKVSAAAARKPVVSRAAVEAVVPVTAKEVVKASFSPQPICAVVADQVVRELRAQDLLDTDEGVALGIAAGTLSRLQVDGDPAGPVGVDVVAASVPVPPSRWSAPASRAGSRRRPAKERVVVGPPKDHVVAAEAEDDVFVIPVPVDVQDLGLVGSIPGMRERW